MFTGIIEAKGVIGEIASSSVSVQSASDPSDPWQIGESVAVNGCCLTVVATDPLRFDLSEETLLKTSFGELKAGDQVNLERAMKAGGRFGGHLVQGHVDATGSLISVRETEQAHVLRFQFPEQHAKYVIEKGSIAVDGISLTVVGLSDDDHYSEFDVWVIPHTWENTNLARLRQKARVNLEFDQLAKYVERIAQFKNTPTTHF